MIQQLSTFKTAETRYWALQVEPMTVVTWWENSHLVVIRNSIKIRKWKRGFVKKKYLLDTHNLPAFFYFIGKSLIFTNFNRSTFIITLVIEDCAFRICLGDNWGFSLFHKFFSSWSGSAGGTEELDTFVWFAVVNAPRWVLTFCDCYLISGTLHVV